MKGKNWYIVYLAQQYGGPRMYHCIISFDESVQMNHELAKQKVYEHHKEHNLNPKQRADAEAYDNRPEGDPTNTWRGRCEIIVLSWAIENE